MVPEVLLTLLEETLPAFRAFFENSVGSVKGRELADRDAQDEAWRRTIRFCEKLPGPWPVAGVLSFEKLVASLEVSPLLIPVHEALLSWGLSWALTDEWCLDIALYTLLLQQLSEYRLLTSNARDARWEFPSARWPSPTASVPSFSFALRPKGEIVASGSGAGQRLFSLTDPYDPVFETREEADLRLNAAFRQELKRYFDQVEASYPDCRPTQLVRQVYFGWLVAYQCLGMDFADIARLETYTPEGVAGGAREFAALLGLTMRPANRGRPSGGPRHP